jgi:diaminohydroxyphosphoribosylaminopyrimidine deaminase / 5-amino-6-(5-phosphoribosylamino)uracil reductase
MKLALQLAERGRGKTRPNPMVGAVIVKGGEVIATGYHHKAGQPHAEAIALQRAGSSARGATLYVNLEPCGHTDKRTPPCTRAIIAGGIRRVVVAMRDPNPKVAGKGIRQLIRAGINVSAGLLRAEADRLNEVYSTWITSGRPFVTMKVAAGLDGKIAAAGGESRWITGEKARAYVYRLRSEADAVMVGIGTVLADDPRLTSRTNGNKRSDPIRIVVDSRLRIPLESRILHLPSARTLLATTKQASNEKIREIEKLGAQVLVLEESSGRVNLAALMKELGRIEITHLLLEGGSELNASMLSEGLVDQVVFLIAPKIIGGRDAVSAVGGETLRPLSRAWRVRDLEVRRLGEDLLVRGRLNKRR